MKINIHPIYNEFFPATGSTNENWDHFKSYDALRLEPDFSIQTKEKLTCSQIAFKIMRVLIIPWLIYETVKYLIGRFIMYQVYAAQKYSAKEIYALRQRVLKKLEDPDNQDMIIREIFLERDGVKYNGLIVANKQTIANKKWALFAPGRLTTIEQSFLKNYEEPYFKAGYNLVMINGPNVGLSQGTATPETLGQAQELGINFIETALKANRIVISGHSLGAAAISWAIQHHHFKSLKNYLAMQLMTFSNLTQVAHKHVGTLAKNAVSWLGYEMSPTKASKKLEAHSIPGVVFEGGRDEIMSGISLADGLKDNKLENTTIRIIPDAEHSHLPTEEITKEIVKWDTSLVH